MAQVAEAGWATTQRSTHLCATNSKYSFEYMTLSGQYFHASGTTLAPQPSICLRVDLHCSTSAVHSVASWFAERVDRKRAVTCTPPQARVARPARGTYRDAVPNAAESVGHLHNIYSAVCCVFLQCSRQSANVQHQLRGSTGPSSTHSECQDSTSRYAWKYQGIPTHAAPIDHPTRQ